MNLLTGNTNQCNSPNRLILIYRKEYVKTNLFLQSYGPMASFHKVIKLLKFKSAGTLHCFQWEAQSTARSNEIS